MNTRHIVLVRHGDPYNFPIHELQVRALFRELTPMLIPAISRETAIIYTSPDLACVYTAERLAHLLGIHKEITDELREFAPPNAFLKKIRICGKSIVILVTHQANCEELLMLMLYHKRLPLLHFCGSHVFDLIKGDVSTIQVTEEGD